MNDPLLVRGFERLRDLLRRSPSASSTGIGPRAMRSVQALAVHEFQHEELLAVRFVQTVDRADVRMIQARQELALPGGSAPAVRDRG